MKRYVYVIMPLLLLGWSSNVFAVSLFNLQKEWWGISNVLTARANNVSKGGKTAKENERKELRSKDSKIMQVLEQDKQVSQQIQEVKNIAEDVKSVGMIYENPVVTDKESEEEIKETIEDNLKNLPDKMIKVVDDDLFKKIGGKKVVYEFKLPEGFDPNKVVTFDDIKQLYITNFVLYKDLLGCENPDEAVLDLCGKVVGLLDDLKNKDRKLTINDVYRLQLYANTISQAIYYVGSLKEFKKGAVILGVDKEHNLLKSMDLVRDYLLYDTGNVDVLPVKARDVNISVSKGVPDAVGDDIKIVIGINNGSVVGMRLYPVDKDLFIPYASVYKVMTIKGLVKGCKKYTHSIWYGYNNIGISSGSNLTPKGMKGIEFNFNLGCYNVF